jgi:hypothetical protein
MSQEDYSRRDKWKKQERLERKKRRKEKELEIG